MSQGERVECEHCDAEVVKGYLRRHQRTPACVASKAAKEMKASGKRRVVGVLYQICRKAGIEVVEARTEATKGSKSIRTSLWAPAWVFDVLGNVDYYSIVIKPFENEEQAAELLAPIFAEAATSPEKRIALDAIKRLSGAEGVVALAATPRVRAERLRREASQLSQRASELLRQAEEIDPSEVEA